MPQDLDKKDERFTFIRFKFIKSFRHFNGRKNVSKAADRLAITQPAMSGILVRLRESFDDPLFVRVQRGVMPTNRALELAPSIKKLLIDIENLLKPIDFELQTAQMTVRIACTDYAMRASNHAIFKAVKNTST